MAQRKTLTERQVEVLRWVGNGCRDGVMPDLHHRISAAALRSRGLVTTRGRGPSWSARITAAGREYLESVDGTEPPVPRQANVSVTQQLVDDVIRAGGRLVLPRPRYGDEPRVDYANRARLAEQYGKVPAGERLAVEYGRDEVTISLVEAPDRPARPELLPIHVPERVARLHRAARGFREHRATHEVSREQLPRATRLVHVIATEAETRGWNVEFDATGRRARLVITTNGEALELGVREGGVHLRGVWEEEVARYRSVDRTASWYRDRDLPSGPYDAAGDGRLAVELAMARDWHFRGRQRTWSDRQSWHLEERLAQLFRELEERFVEAARLTQEQQLAAEHRAEQERLAAEQRERDWERLMGEAHEKLIETARFHQLKRETEAWELAARIRDYCDALDNAQGEDPAAAKWVAWARGYAEQIDPLNTPRKLPPDPGPTRQALQEHLPPGWSVYGPEHTPPIGRLR